ncbi:MAG TPA: PadR family transcriptional regulator [Solirubrobacteraceae bacterium]|nr:PadR family transcriptional regulator [Solirubrobacteraceae bacterium]
MPRPRNQLTAGEWAILALLDEEPAHGFALARALATGGEVGRVWDMRRPLVYRALETLQRLELITPVATLPSDSGPQRTIFEPTAEGRRLLADWLQRPVEHVRDARSLLMLKLLFLSRRDADPAPLLRTQREQFSGLAQRLSVAADAAEGFERGLLLWRLHSTAAAVQFTEAMLAEPTLTEP